MRTLRREEVERLGESGARVGVRGRHAFDKIFQEFARSVRRRRIREAGPGPGPGFLTKPGQYIGILASIC